MDDIIVQLPLPFEGKVCNKCHIWQPLTEYHRNRAMPDGLQYTCKSCDRERNRQYMARKRITDRDILNARHKAWYARKGKDHAREYNRQHPEQSRAICKRWREKPTNDGNRVNADYRLRKYGIPAGHTKSEWRALCDAAGGRCMACGKEAKLERDHIIPLSQGGTDDISNLQVLCHSCNSRKWRRTIDYRPTT
jgi:5-methylcytosine-specific restriction endonuclease McrA